MKIYRGQVDKLPFWIFLVCVESQETLNKMKQITFLFRLHPRDSEVVLTTLLKETFSKLILRNTHIMDGY